MKRNPFKFGTVVEGPYFTDREEEQAKISSFIKGENHLILISPRRYGKTSLIKKVINESKIRYIYLDLQLITSSEDFAAQLLKRIYRISPIQKMKDYIKSFRIIPSVSINPLTGEVDVSFNKSLHEMAPLEDVLNLIEKYGSSGEKIIVILDEFQEIFRITAGLDRFLRSIMQVHKNVNYIFLGSSESLIREIFEQKKSPFYHFGYLITIDKIPKDKFESFLEERFLDQTKEFKAVSSNILEKTDSHPYYTQQLAFSVWESLNTSGYSIEIVETASNEIVLSHDNDYERLWNTFNRTEMMILIGMSESELSPLSEDFSRLYGTGPSSTIFSSLKRLTHKGILVKSKKTYLMDDPFFKQWIRDRRKL
jgi:AAA+ ATPase superfamily predicted ATPase